jgi:hypothetical protein
MRESEFFAVFDAMGRVAEAWLQPQRRESCASRGAHRGFGFVIFQEAEAIAALLGEGRSTGLLEIGYGKPVEIKHVMSSTEVVKRQKVVAPHGSKPRLAFDKRAMTPAAWGTMPPCTSCPPIYEAARWLANTTISMSHQTDASRMHLAALLREAMPDHYED